VRLNIFPDGGVARLRLRGTPTEAGRLQASLHWLNALPADAAAHELLACCASRRWASAVAAARPFSHQAELDIAAARSADTLDPSDWLEAFAAHPRLGERATGSDQHARWSGGEQSRLDDVDAVSRTRLAEANRAYEERFGHVFLFCASGRSADEMLAACSARLKNDAATELAVAAGEQRKITALRLSKLLGGPSD
jgi:allantoicase